MYISVTFGIVKHIPTEFEKFHFEMFLIMFYFLSNPLLAREGINLEETKIFYVIFLCDFSINCKLYKKSGKI